MSLGRDTPVFVFLRLTIKIKLEAVFLHAIDPIEGDGNRLVRKSLNAFGNGTRGLGGVDDGPGEANNEEYAQSDDERRNPAQQTEAVAGAQGGGHAERKYGGNGCGDVGSRSPQQVMIARNCGGGQPDTRPPATLRRARPARCSQGAWIAMR